MDMTTTEDEVISIFMKAVSLAEELDKAMTELLPRYRQALQPVTEEFASLLPSPRVGTAFLYRLMHSDLVSAQTTARALNLALANAQNSAVLLVRSMAKK